MQDLAPYTSCCVNARPGPVHCSAGGRDPLVLDLDGDGVELTAMNNSAAYVDLDNDGIAEQVGWVSADDGLLAIDINGNARPGPVHCCFAVRT